MGYALRHVADLSSVLREFMRVLAPGGRVCLLEITAPTPGCSARSQGVHAWRRTVDGALHGRHRDMPKLMRYYWDTIENCAHPSLILAAMCDAGLVDVYRHVDLGIFSDYCGASRFRGRRARAPRGKQR